MSILQAMVAEERARRDTEAARLQAIEQEFKAAVADVQRALEPLLPEIKALVLKSGEFSETLLQEFMQKSAQLDYLLPDGIAVVTRRFRGGGLNHLKHSGLRLQVWRRTDKEPCRLVLKCFNGSINDSTGSVTYRPDQAPQAIEDLLRRLVKEVA